MKVSVKFYEQQFTHEVSKKAYLKACKWLAKNIVSKVEIGETTFSIHKVNDADLPTFNVVLYCSLDNNEIQKGFCERCKEMHAAFFINQNYNCDACKVKAYIDGLKQKINNKKSYRKKRLDYLLEE